MRTKTGGAIAAAVLALLTNAAAGCSTNELENRSLHWIERNAIEHMLTLDSVQVVGWGRMDGASMELDLSIGRSGRCRGTISRDGATADFLVAGSRSYLKGNRAFWKATTGSAQSATQISETLGAKWAKLPAAAQLGSICDMDELVADWGENADGKKMRGRKGESTQVAGVDALELVYERGKETTVVWVSTEAPHRVLQMESTGGKEPGRFIFSGYNREFGLDVPGAGQVVDIGKM